MTFLLDTHALIWWLSDSSRLSSTARDVISDSGSGIYVSAASASEVATKYRKGKLPGGELLLPDFSDVVMQQGFILLNVTADRMVRSVFLERPHKDPFDRIIAAQSILEKMTLISIDSVMPEFGITVRW